MSDQFNLVDFVRIAAEMFDVILISAPWASAFRRVRFLTGAGNDSYT